MLVYFHRNNKTMQVFYVGIGSRIDRAKASGITDRSVYWHRYVAKHGNPVIQIVHSNLSKVEAIWWEIHYIKIFGKTNNGGQLVNTSDGGELADNLARWQKENPDKNHSFSSAHKIRMVNNNPMHNPETVDKVRRHNTGKKVSPETRLKQRLLKLGKPSARFHFKHSQDTIEKMRLINKEISNRPEVIAKIKHAKIGYRNVSRNVKVDMIDLDTLLIVKTFDCAVDALTYLGKPIKNGGNISSVCNGIRKSAFGYKWQFSLPSQSSLPV